MYGSVSPIKTAPSRYALKEFGGTLTIDEFRKLSRSNVIVNMPDETHIVQEVSIKRDYIDNIKTNADEKFQEISRSTAVGDTLKLKRSKPLKRDDNNLEKSLGITRKK